MPQNFGPYIAPRPLVVPPSDYALGIARNPGIMPPMVGPEPQSPEAKAAADALLQQISQPSQPGINAAQMAASAPPPPAEYDPTKDVNAYLNDPDARRLQQEEYDKAQEQIGQQRMSAQDSQKLLEGYLAQKQQLDLSPLLALAQNEFHGPGTSGYQRPLTPEERMLQAGGLQENVRRAQGGVSDKELQLLKTKSLDRQSAAKLLLEAAQEKGRLAAMKDKTGGKIDLQNEKATRDYLNKEGETITGLGKVAYGANAVKKALEGKTRIDPLDPALNRAFADMAVNYNSNIGHLGALSEGDKKIIDAALSAPRGLVVSTVMQAMGYSSPEQVTQAMDEMLARTDKYVSDYGQKVALTPRLQGAYDVLNKNYQSSKAMGSGYTAQAIPDAPMTEDELTQKFNALPADIRKKYGGS